MTKVNAMDTRAIEGGASKYVYCPTCGYKRKSNWLERIFESNSRIQMYMSARHVRGGRFTRGQSVHK